MWIASRHKVQQRNPDDKLHCNDGGILNFFFIILIVITCITITIINTNMDPY
jgi:hypothetical protein